MVYRCLFVVFVLLLIIITHFHNSVDCSTTVGPCLRHLAVAVGRAEVLSKKVILLILKNVHSECWTLENNLKLCWLLSIPQIL